MKRSRPIKREPVTLERKGPTMKNGYHTVEEIEAQETAVGRFSDRAGVMHTPSEHTPRCTERECKP